ncbi:diguanylate cyclase domain-containing protein [Sphingomonas sp. MMS24-JH45]
MGTLFRQHAATFDRVHHLAAFDPVTGLANRVSFRAPADAALEALPPEASAALFFIDLDRFKAVNDSRGHATGDQLLLGVAKRPRRRYRARWAGKPDRPSRRGRIHHPRPRRGSIGDHAQLLGDTVLAALAEPFELPGGVVIGGSIGVALRPEHGTNVLTT